MIEVEIALLCKEILIYNYLPPAKSFIIKANERKQETLTALPENDLPRVTLFAVGKNGVVHPSGFGRNIDGHAVALHDHRHLLQEPG